MPRKHQKITKAYNKLCEQAFNEELNIPDEFIEWQFYFYNKAACVKEFERWYKFKRLNRTFAFIINVQKNDSTMPKFLESKRKINEKSQAEREEEEYFEQEYWNWQNKDPDTVKPKATFASSWQQKQMVMPEPSGLSGGTFVCH